MHDKVSNCQRKLTKINIIKEIKVIKLIKEIWISKKHKGENITVINDQ